MSQSVIGQDDSLSKKSMLVDDVKIKGVYLSFIEFQQNNPSFRDTFIVKEGKWTNTRNVLYTLNADGKLKKISENIWGYCDGKDVYIRSTDYTKLIHFGYFCVFKGTGFAVLPMYWPGGGPGSWKYGPMHHGSNSFETTDTFILDYITGSQLKLKKANLVNFVLSKDEELLIQFRNEEKGKAVLLDYVMKFNSRNTSRLIGTANSSD